MHLSLPRVRLVKAAPLAISRGSTAAVQLQLESPERNGINGIGETGRFDTAHCHYDTEAIAAELEGGLEELWELWPICSRILSSVLV